METPSHYQTLFVARQPVLRPDETIWGYELLFRSSDKNFADIIDDSEATSSIIADGMTLAMESMHGIKRVLINFPEKMLLDGTAYALPKNNCIIEILEDVRPSPEILEALRNLKESGYILAVDDYFGQPELQPFLDLADIVKVDILEFDGNLERIAQTIDPLKKAKKHLLAEKVENKAVFNDLKDLGFSLYQGFFFAQPEIIPGRKLSSNETSKLRLLSELSNKEFEPKRLSEILQSDPHLSYRLLRYINSVGIGLQNKITSLKRAIDLMGLLQTKQWLRTALMADLSTSGNTSELAFRAVHRAKFLESICSIKTQGECKPEILFTTGLFSMLDAMLGIEMTDVLQQLPLDKDIVEALTGEGEIRDFLMLSLCYEKGTDNEKALLAEQAGLPVMQLDELYAKAMYWTQKMFHIHTSTPRETTQENV
ncbi:MAG: hypothetical protein CL942_11045 [Desulfovibrio sp.]|nr:hypothetical protein [Desulfovibrio sp.]|tara:strand:+ start:6782 stop:8059 length:1278 start_codon:yes stop_codon:yes gene_type:complete